MLTASGAECAEPGSSSSHFHAVSGPRLNRLEPVKRLSMSTRPATALGDGSKSPVSSRPMYTVLASMAKKEMVCIGCVHALLDTICRYGVTCLLYHPGLLVSSGS